MSPICFVNELKTKTKTNECKSHADSHSSAAFAYLCLPCNDKQVLSRVLRDYKLDK